MARAAYRRWLESAIFAFEAEVAVPVRLLVVLSVSLVVVGAGCACGADGARPARDGGTSRLDARSVDAPGVPSDGGPDTGPRDAYLAPNPDAFFFADPPAEICYPDGGMGPWPDPPGGTPECPDDRSREGCLWNGVCVSTNSFSSSSDLIVFPVSLRDSSVACDSSLSIAEKNVCCRGSTRSEK